MRDKNTSPKRDPRSCKESQTDINLDVKCCGVECSLSPGHLLPDRGDYKKYWPQDGHLQSLFEENLTPREISGGQDPARDVLPGIRPSLGEDLFHFLTGINPHSQEDACDDVEITGEYRETAAYRGRSRKFPPFPREVALARARLSLHDLLPSWSPITFSRVKAMVDKAGIWQFLSKHPPFPRLGVRQGRQLLAHLPAPDVAYYRANFGFDPRHKVLLDEQGAFYYEAEFPLFQDPSLHAAGILIAARVQVTGKRVTNAIVFKRHGKEAGVPCIHTAVCEISLDEITRPTFQSGILERARSLEQPGGVYLRPEDHFVSLRSYVAGIAEMGIANVARASYLSGETNALTLPFGFNAMMQSQVFRALKRLAPMAFHRLALDHLLFLLETVPNAWLAPRFSFLADLYGFRAAVLGDLPTFAGIFEEFPRPWFAHWALSRTRASPIVEYLATKGFRDTRAS